MYDVFNKYDYFKLRQVSAIAYDLTFKSAATPFVSFIFDEKYQEWRVTFNAYDLILDECLLQDILLFLKHLNFVQHIEILS